MTAHEGDDHAGSSDADAEQEYVFAEGDVGTATELLDEAFTGLDFGYPMIVRLRNAAARHGVTDSPLEMELIHATGHDLHREVGGKAGCELGRPELHTALVWPRPISETPAAVVELWLALSQTVAAAPAIARLEDLLFELGVGNGRERVQRAAEAYLTAVDAGDPESLEAGDAMLRVWQLARRVREADVDAEIRRRMSEVAARVMESSPGQHPGIVLPLLRALADGPLRTGPDPHDVDALLEQAASIYKRGDLASQIASDRRGRARGDADELDRIAREEVAAYLADADAATEPSVRMFRLNDAARVATQRGQGDLARQAAAEMQKIKPSELGLKPIRTESSIPAYVPESFLAPFTRGASWRDGLAYFLAGPPPSGSVDNLREAAARSKGTLASLFRTTVFGAGGMPRASTQDDADEDAHDLSQSTAIAAQHFGLWLSEGLARMGERYDLPSVDDLTSAIVSVGCRDPYLARGLAKGLRHYWLEDYESSIAVVLPKFEAALRALLRELDEGIYRVQVSKDPGGYVGLYVLLDELEGLDLDPDWAHFFRWLLLGPFGANIRNDVAHGFLFDPGPVFAALTLRAVAVVALLAGPLPDDRFTEDADRAAEADRDCAEVVDGLRRPTGRRSVIEALLSFLGGGLERVLWWTRARQSRLAARRLPPAQQSHTSSDDR